MNELENKFSNVIQKILPKFYHQVRTCKHYFARNENDKYIKIVIACSDYLINRVPDQYVQCVSLMFDLTKQDLTIQMFGGCGGNRIFTIPQKNLYLAMESVKIPFRIAKSEKSALEALERFCTKYLEALKNNRNILMYQNYVNYDDILN